MSNRVEDLANGWLVRQRYSRRLRCRVVGVLEEVRAEEEKRRVG